MNPPDFGDMPDFAGFGDGQGKMPDFGNAPGGQNGMPDFGNSSGGQGGPPDFGGGPSGMFSQEPVVSTTDYIYAGVSLAAIIIAIIFAALFKRKRIQI